MTAAPAHLDPLGLVAIGRNEGERLRRCLASVVGRAAVVVYVDSGSTDGSVELARALGVEVVELDTSRPFTAARARNAGYERLKEQHPGLRYVMFVDGDCEVVGGWLDTAVAALQGDEKLAVVCGRRRERFPDATIFNKLCDMEWDTPVGDTKACGGDAVYRAAAFDEAGGFDPALICGEEPQLCLRLRQQGWRVERLDAEMTRHDADMTRWGQWWKRCVRGGWAHAQGADQFGGTPERYNVKQARSNWFWGAVVPGVSGVLVVLGVVLEPWLLVGAAVLPLGYAVLVWRVARYRMHRGDSAKDAWRYGVLTAMGKPAYALGQVRYHRQKRRGGPATLIEYKTSAASRLQPAGAPPEGAEPKNSNPARGAA